MDHKKGHQIRSVEAGSIAQEMGIEAGDSLLAINGEEVEDIFDYQYLIQDEYIEVLIRKPSQEEWLLEIDKEYEEDLGLVFENGLMDDYRSCCNKCIFCFIDQMPPGMRETLYFKDDDSRLSFLQGNYVTLTNLSDRDVERIIRYHLSPINISFQTTNPQLRCRMLNNRFAGEALKKADRFFEARIEMNGQIVLCKGINDGEELEKSLRDLSRYLPYLRSSTRFSLLRRKTPRKCWNRSTGGKKSFLTDTACISSMPATNGTSWRDRSFRMRTTTTAICSWKTGWGCCAF